MSYVSSMLGRSALSLVAASLPLFVVLAGCGDADDCEHGETICRGTEILGCGLADNRHGPRQFLANGKCARACVQWTESQGRRAQCALAAVKDSRCPAEGSRSLCLGNTRVTCNTGWAKEEETCPAHCALTTHGVGHCALTSGPDVRCAGLVVNQSSTCDGATVLACFDGLVTAETPCKAPLEECRLRTYQTSTATDAWCGSRNPDARCRSASDAWCDGSISMSCEADGRTYGTDCARDGRRCELSTLPSGAKLAFCQ